MDEQKCLIAAAIVKKIITLRRKRRNLTHIALIILLKNRALILNEVSAGPLIVNKYTIDFNSRPIKD